MLYHPSSPYYAQFLAVGTRAGRRMDALNAAGNNVPVPATASAAQARAANGEK